MRIKGDTNKKSDKLDNYSPINPATKHGLIVVVLFALALILLLAFAGQAGVWGALLSRWLKLVFGWAAYVFPLVLLAVGYRLLHPEFIPRPIQAVGLVLTTVGVTGLMHVTLSSNMWRPGAMSGIGGGYLGYFSLYPLIKTIGPWGASVILTAFVIGGILILFQTSLQHLWSYVTKVWEIFTKPLSSSVSSNSPASVNNYSTPTSPATETKPKVLRQIFQSRVVSSGEPKQPHLLEIKSTKLRKVQIPLDFLERREGKPTSGDIEANMEKIRRTLENFGIEVTMGKVNVGPTVTQYTLAPAEGVKLSQITTLSNDLALALAAHPIRIEAPIPGQSLVGIEVPNQIVATVSLREIIESDQFKHRSSSLTASLGKDVAGLPIISDVGRMPHLLIAGATGSGKSVCINNIIISLLYTNSPDELKFIIIDPKRVELASYNDIPHLLTPVITDVAKTINALKWVVGEMDRRYQVLSVAGKRNIQGYNQGNDQIMPYLFVVIDELADLMAVAAADVEAAIIRLAQMARAVGIHLIVATQRPSVDVITGLIKANITSRIAFSVASATDSRTILDTGGAEKLLGRGDGLFTTAELSKPKRFQAAFISDAEIERITAFLKEQAKPDYNPDVVAKHGNSGVVGGSSSGDDGDDSLLNEAKLVVIRAGKASASLLQRRLRVGYARAARLLDLLEERGIIGPGDGAKPREVLVNREDLVEDYVSLPEEGQSEVVDEVASSTEGDVSESTEEVEHEEEVGENEEDSDSKV